ncbi:3-hydroxyacyl-CoA dehydrogenase NAD-binding domain-containing protein [Paenibacillus aurantius]|uniref:3-hydroxyacyl-CoA dehydrogenase NAD-binding domain-containing protein n=1 Tax=Paenibacillus aurantius TaxID=2918900 RepID=A0AA96LKG8_9BACL|nr:3-hydroxyacyl-CoA dehydrogenase NAD-binding domain-containing protein [Paenibacillus aurantius]WNQ13052.1 3-hydroxyacyl-CoA dehydrogenase NAD-binding domain-containing protein [Paenibacillus aurantius]
MNQSIRKAAVIGSGVMGAAIAAHLANAGIACLLLDVVPGQLTEEEKAKGLTLEHPAVRSRLAVQAIARLKKTKPSPLYDESFAERIRPGNLEDHLGQLSGVDWILEVVVENLSVKKELLARIEKNWTPGTVVSSNTSGISINEMAAGCSEEFRKHFLGTHFFNPPRYMRLLEIIPGDKTDPALVERIKEFGEKKLGKDVVIAKDTPNFIANRIGTYGLLVTLRELLDKGFTVEEADAVTGPAMGRPKSATFRTLDLVGLDTFLHVADNVHGKVTDANEKEAFAAPDVMKRMVANGWLGEKGGRGFYLKRKGPDGSEILSLNLSTLEYAPQRKVTSASLEAAKMAKGAREKTKALLAGGDRYAELAWTILKKVLLYAADKVGEIADSVEAIDEAMRKGFNWELGPFETWDAIGLVKSVERMEKEGESVPAWVRECIAAGKTSFYRSEGGKRFGVFKGEYRQLEERPERISLKDLKERNRTVRSNSGASLIDLGDGVACLEFHSPNNAIGADILLMIQQSVEEVEKNFEGLVVANQGRNFCVGANLMLLLMEAQEEEWEEIDGIIRLFQNTMMKLKRSVKPVVAAPHRMTLGGGVEACLPADRIVASAETYFGLVEVGVGLIPAGGGCKELALRASRAARLPDADLQPHLNQAFETIGMAKVSTSGHDAKRLGLFRPEDRIVLHPDHLLYEAKKTVLGLAQAGYEPAPEEKIRAAGSDGKAVLKLGALGMRQGGYISDHDLLIANKLAHVLAGGDVPAGSLLTEPYMLDLEREAFLSLCGEPKTQARMQHMLAKGKALRN